MVLLLLLLICLTAEKASAASESGCRISQGPYNPHLKFQHCAPCAYITEISVRGGCWIDGVVSFKCSDGNVITVGAGNSDGGSPSTVTSASGFVAAQVSSAYAGDQFVGAAALVVVTPDGKFSETIGQSFGCTAFLPSTKGVLVTYRNENRTTAAPGERIVGLQAESIRPVPTWEAYVGRVGFLVGAVRSAAPAPPPATSAGCHIRAAPNWNNPGLKAYNCPGCSYMTELNIRGGCWLDAILSFKCSDGSLVIVATGNLGGGQLGTIVSPPGFTGATVSSAFANQRLLGAAALSLTTPNGKSPKTYAKNNGCVANLPSTKGVPVVYRNAKAVLGRSNEKIVGLQVATVSPVLTWPPYVGELHFTLASSDKFTGTVNV